METACATEGAFTASFSRGTLSQIEARLRCVTDDELLALARTLGVSTDSLFPEALKKRKKAQ